MTVPTTLLDAIPLAIGKGSGGPWRISVVALNDYNASHSVDIERGDISAKGRFVAEYLLGKIVDTYAKEAGLAPDWNDSDYVELVALGYVSGQNAVARYLAKIRGVQNLDAIQAIAKAYGGILSQQKRYDVARNIAAKYMALKSPPKAADSLPTIPLEPIPKRKKATKSKVAMFAAHVLLLMPLGLLLSMKRKKK